jgi:hypothetical protein
MGNAQQGPAAQAQLQLLAALMESGARAGRAMVAAGRGVDRAAERKALEDECREFATRHQAELEPLWRCYDANNDGAGSRAERRATQCVGAHSVRQARSTAASVGALWRTRCSVSATSSPNT